MKTKITLAACLLGSALIAADATAATAPTGDTMAPANGMGAMHPTTGGMMSTHKPKPHKPKKPMTGAMAPAGNTMAPANTMSGSH